MLDTAIIKDLRNVRNTINKVLDLIVESGQSIVVIKELRCIRDKVNRVLDLTVESGQSCPVPSNPSSLQPVQNTNTELGSDFYKNLVLSPWITQPEVQTPLDLDLELSPWLEEREEILPRFRVSTYLHTKYKYRPTGPAVVTSLFIKEKITVSIINNNSENCPK